MTVADHRQRLKRMSLAQARQAVRELRQTKAACVMVGSKILELDYWVVNSRTYATVQAGLVELKKEG